MLLAVLAAVAVYTVSVVCLRAIVKEDLARIPHGDKIGALLHLR